MVITLGPIKTQYRIMHCCETSYKGSNLLSDVYKIKITKKFIIEHDIFVELDSLAGYTFVINVTNYSWFDSGFMTREILYEYISLHVVRFMHFFFF